MSGNIVLGRVYVWTPDPDRSLGGYVTASIVPLPNLQPSSGEGAQRLRGRYVRVRNGGAVNEPDASGGVRAVPIGDAQPDAEGNFIFEHFRGGGRMDLAVLAAPEVRSRYIQASHFGEVNTYFHLDRIAAYVDGLLSELGAPSLPRVTAVVNAHHAATEKDGLRDGRKKRYWLPFQGGHYRLPGKSQGIQEHDPISTSGEIHLGPGWKLLHHGALVDVVGDRYRSNASHNAGILYHEYGHHIVRHTADLKVNALRPCQRQINRKTALDEGFSDYWAATMLGVPHIWAWHRQHDGQEIHFRSLASSKTMTDYDVGKGADEHRNGTIWAAALWDLRESLREATADGVRRSDLLVLKALLLLGKLSVDDGKKARKSIRLARNDFASALSLLLRADELLYAGENKIRILGSFGARGISPDQRAITEKNGELFMEGGPPPGIAEHDPRMKGASAATEILSKGSSALDDTAMQTLLKHVPPEEIPPSEEIFSAEGLAEYLHTLKDPPPALITVGDIMLAGRTRRFITEHGPGYPFEGVLPILKRAPIVLGNLEGPFTRHSRQASRRNYTYRVKPKLAQSLKQAGINVVSLANNHLLDCGRQGVLDTVEALTNAGVAPLGAGASQREARTPFIGEVGDMRVGLLEYYWNQRCAATPSLPGGAMDSPGTLEADIRGLRERVRRIVVTFHWGMPYEREPLPQDREKAHFAVECGADVVVGHHPHVVQPFEVYRGRLICYSIGNFAFGSGNSRAEGVIVGIRFEDRRTAVEIYPLYVKNRDPRISYQPKVLTGGAAERLLRRLADMSGKSGELLRIEKGRGMLDLPWADRSG